MLRKYSLIAGAALSLQFGGKADVITPDTSF